MHHFVILFIIRGSENIELVSACQALFQLLDQTP